MSPYRFCLFVAALSLCGCVHSPVPAPPEFQLSTDALQQQYPATRTTGAAHLFAHEIVTTLDEFGRETHQASGGALLLKESNPPIHAKASTIVITPNFAEVHGEAVVKKNDRLYIGKDDSTKIIIDGTAIKPEGPHLVRTIAAESDQQKPSKLEETTISTTQEPVIEAKPSSRREPKKTTQSVASKSTSKTAPSAVKPKANPPVSKPASPPATKPKALPTTDRARLLELMRAPKDP
ncbi:hypothetical protein [Prosthecobacter sp.]|uniref:hypothetical protein n=1 Tax=Prosthecobacter sp. TaxID=1965333 RepID=UPI001DD1B954|nr:hypothetical protein [Prosthecobacter sp.]MCB1275623.1 hypothetical protein [Prosthecobacter sp.]